jgi:serine/threonine protein kinase
VVDQMRFRVHDTERTMTKAVGTFLWMAPEVFRGDQNYGGAVDVYSYGVILWELATRQTPWSDIVRDDLPRLEFFRVFNMALQMGRRPGIPVCVATAYPDYVKILERCWAGDPGDRPLFPEVAEAMAACLRRVACMEYGPTTAADVSL